MKTLGFAVLIALGAFAPGLALAAIDPVAAERQKIDAIAGETIQAFLHERPGAQEMYDQAYGYAVFQDVKVVIGISGAGGRGVAVNNQTKQRTYMKMGSAGIGIGLGGQKSRLLLLFRDAAAYQDFLKNGWEGNAAAVAAAGKEGKNAKATFEQAVEVYQFTRAGLLAKAELSGTKFWPHKKLNAFDPDSDGDGVLDSVDACLGTPAGATVDARGCWLLSNVLFETASAELRAPAEPVLNEVAAVLLKNPNVRIRIDGHTDAAGPSAYNDTLSLRRAESVRAALIIRGIAAERLDVRGFGESAPIVQTGSDGRAPQNRRVELTPIF